MEMLTLFFVKFEVKLVVLFGNKNDKNQIKNLQG
jgi:hypothetical protein